MGYLQTVVGLMANTCIWA